jgi:hypothetical protein
LGEWRLPDLALAGRFPRKGEEPWWLPREGKWDSRSGGASILALILPNLVAPPGECGLVLEISRVDYVPNVGRHLAKEQDLLDLVHRGRLQGIVLVHQDQRKFITL